MSRYLTYNDDNTVTINDDSEHHGKTFYRESWVDVKVGELQHPMWFIDSKSDKNKRDLAWRFATWATTYDCEEDLSRNEDEDESYHEHQDRVKMWQVNYVRNLGFEQTSVDRWHTNWSYVGWKHKLSMADLRDLFVQRFTPFIEDKIEEYKANNKLSSQMHSDGNLREHYVEKLQCFLDFRNTWTNFETKMRSIVDDTTMAIGKGHYQRLSGKFDTLNDGYFVPEPWRGNHFRAMEFAQKWLDIFTPIIEEIRRLESPLNFPYKVDWKGNEYQIADLSTKKHHIALHDLVSFRYQDFLTWMLDFKKRFSGDYRRGNQCDSLSGWGIYSYSHDGEYRTRDSDVADWDFFELDKHSGYGDTTTWGRFVEGLALNGQIRAISDPVMMRDLVHSTNYDRHKDNVERNRYKKSKLIQVVVSNPFFGVDVENMED